MKSLLVLLCFFIFGHALAIAAPLARTIPVAPDVEVSITHYAACGRTLILWLPSEFGLVPTQHAAAEKLAQRGYNVWLADLFGARFLPVAPSSLDQIPNADVAGLLQAATKKYRKIILVSSGRGAVVALGGVQHWQAKHKGRTIAGAVLLFPNLLTGSPEAGEEATYLPIAQHTRLPIAILQGELSPWYWQLDALTQQLEQGGSRVAVKHLPGMRDRFYFRDDALPRERELGDQLDTLIDEAIRNLPALKRKTP